MDLRDYLITSKLLGSYSESPGGSPGGGGSDDVEWIDDGNTHIWIDLPDGRTRPMLNCVVSNTVMVDWGDGSEQEVLTDTRGGTEYHVVHDYARPGEYVITLSGGGVRTNEYLICSEPDRRDNRGLLYRNAVKKCEFGNNFTHLGNNSTAGAFRNCSSLANVKFSDVITFGNYAFSYCRSLKNVEIPGNGAISANYIFNECSSLESVILSGCTSIPAYAFSQCSCLTDIVIPETVTSIAESAFYGCTALASIKIPGSVSYIKGNAFGNCYGMAFYDFTEHTSIPTLESTSVFTGNPTDFEIRVPMALVDEWKVATNWSTYADQIVVKEV